MGYSQDTICVQGGWQPKNGEPRVLPIYQSTTFKYATSEEMGKLFDLEEEGYFYSRLQNPTNDVVAQKICDLEGGVAAMLTSSGQAATMLAVTNICEAGDHVVCAAKVYGGTSNLLAVTLKRFGIETTLVDQDAPAEELEKAFQPNTKAVFAETISNPAGVVLDIDKFVKLAHEHGVPMICDNTFATPINCRPFEFGVDIVTHSTTKYMDGHAMALGGAIVDSGNFDWDAHADKFPGLTTPDESYHGVIYTQKFGKKAYITKATAQLMRDMGACQSPQNAFRPCRQQIPCAGRKIHAERNLRRSLLRTEGRKRRCDAFYERPENGSNCNTRCRCKKLRSAPGKPYPPPAERSAAHRSRCSAGSDPSVSRHRGCERYHCRP